MVLREIQHNLIVDQILSSVEGLKFLILDDFTTKMISNVIKMKDLLIDGNVIDVRHISITLKEPNTVPVIYFLVATEDNVRHIISHYEVSHGKSLYGDVHIFFTSFCSETLLEQLTTSKKLIRKLKSLKEVNCGFIRCNDYAFQISATKCFSMYYNPNDRHLAESTYLTRLATQVASVAIQLRHFPAHIRYLNSFSSEINKDFAMEVRRLAVLYHMENREEVTWYNADSTIIILDRSFDTITPVLHDLTLEALARDYLAIGLQGNDPNGLHQNEYVYSMETNRSDEMKVEQVLYLDDSNTYWRKIRYCNILEAITMIQSLIDDLKNQEQLEQGKVAGLTLGKLTELMSKYPEQRRFRETIGALSHLVEHTVNLYNKKVIECEQYLAINLEQKKDSWSNWKIVEEVLKSKWDDKVGRQLSLSLNERIRLIYLYARSLSKVGGISLGEIKRCFREAGVPEDFIPILANMDYLGTPLIAQSGQWATFKEQVRNWKQEVSCEFEHKVPIRPDNMPSVVDWCPNIYHRIKELIQYPEHNHLEFPVLEVRPKPIIDKSKNAQVPPSETKNSSVPNNVKNRSSVIVFIAGGMTYGEAKYAQLLNDYFEKKGGPMVFLGASQLMNPDDFLEKVNNISSLTKYETSSAARSAAPQRASVCPQTAILQRKASPSVASGSLYGAASGPIRASAVKPNKSIFFRKKDKTEEGTTVKALCNLTKRINKIKEEDNFNKELVETVYGSSDDFRLD